MSVVTVSLDGIDSIRKYLERSPEIASEAARLAVNYGAKRARQIGAAEMRKQVAFTQAYLSDNKRLSVVKQATRSDLSAIVRGRDRPTSLARFAKNRPSVGELLSAKRGGSFRKRVKPRVQVKPGAVRQSKQSYFFMPLRAGKALDATTGNVGLAVRAKGNIVKRLKNKAGLIQYAPNLYLLYGPSVDQVFRSVSNQISAPVLRDTEREFYRQFTRLSK